MLALFFYFCFVPITAEATRTTALLSAYYRCDINVQINHATSIQNLSMDIQQSIAGYLQRKDIHSFMRTNQNNLLSCKQYIYKLISIKFNYLLRHKSNKININHLLSIPFVDSIAMDARDMPFYFRKILNASKNSASSKYIGLDTITNHAFISFRIKKIGIDDDPPPCKIITILFNETNIYCIYFSNGPVSYKFPMIIHALKKQPDSSKESKNMNKAINLLLITGKVQISSNGNATWCLISMWDSYMFWPRIRNAVINARPNVYLMFAFGIAIGLIIFGIMLVYESSVHLQRN